MKKIKVSGFYSMLILLTVLSPTVTALTTESKTPSPTLAEIAWSEMWQNIKQNYAYLEPQQLDLSCIENEYSARLKKIHGKTATVLFFERFLLEFTDSHMSLNTHTDDSYRMHSPITVKAENGRFYISDYWQNQLINSEKIRVGAQLVSINQQTPAEIIKKFPTICLNKKLISNQQWIINKTLAGIRSKPRLAVFAHQGKNSQIDLDQLQYKQHPKTLTLKQTSSVAIINLHNSLGKTDLIAAFDQAIDKISQNNDHEGLILDLRNTINGGDSYMARAIISRLIKQQQPYQKHRFEEQRGGAPAVSRMWTEYVTPRLSSYDKPIVVLVNAWTGSMGEGLAIGLHGMHRAQVIGTPMAGLLGAVYGFSLEGLGFGYQLPAEQLFHVDGTPRADFVPDEIIHPSNSQEDAVLERAIQWINNRQEN